MTDIIGVLGESTNTAVGTYTAYTCPTGKAAKVRLMYHGVAANTATLEIKVNGMQVCKPAAASGADNMFSSIAALTENTSTTAPAGDADATTVAPAPAEYYLSAGDLVQYVIGVVNFASMSFQVVGSEIDVS